MTHVWEVTDEGGLQPGLPFHVRLGAFSPEMGGVFPPPPLEGAQIFPARQQVMSRICRARVREPQPQTGSLPQPPALPCPDLIGRELGPRGA